MKAKFNYSEEFVARHIGIRPEDLPHMLEIIGVDSLEQLIGEVIPKDIRLNTDLNLEKALAESEYIKHIRQTIAKNKVMKSYIGWGYYNTFVPSVIQRNIFENPGWYTQYTPYQAEISQGRLEALLNFQTLIIELTGMPIANASLLDEATAAAEAMAMLHRVMSKNLKKNKADKFFIDQNIFPQTVEVVKGRAERIGIEIVVGDFATFELDEKVYGALVQYPAKNGEIIDYSDFVEKMHKHEIQVAVAADILSLALLTPPGEWGADVVLGTTQRFGVPMGFGGPHAAYFATKEEHKRQVPGRIIGASHDNHGNLAYRMALQTREQHIRREKATSNICTAQALLAIMAGMYGVYHGKDGLQEIARRINDLSNLLAENLKKLGFETENKYFFDTISVKVAESEKEKLKAIAVQQNMNLNYFEQDKVSISLNETTRIDSAQTLINIFAELSGKKSVEIEDLRIELETLENNSLDNFLRSDDFMSHPVFNTYRSETEMMRYIKTLENKDLSLTQSMIPLGSCTMKLNAASEMMALSSENVGNIHPFVPKNQVEGYLEIIEDLGKYLQEITGFTAVSFQPNSGAQGEFAGLLAIKKYHEHHGNHNRNITLIPSSAHGTNPASAVMAGMKVMIVKCDDEGNIDVDDLREKAQANKENLAALMVTYPSTHGVYEEKIREICEIIHENGGLVYMDGANMNAQVGLTNPATIGADVCHLNLHKTFAIPHGGGGPGMGPIAVNNKLKDFLPKHPLFETGGEHGTMAVSAAPFGSASILLISYAYIKMLGVNGLKHSSEYAILNANYLKSKLEKEYSILYQHNNRVAHEFIVDFREYKKSCGIEVEDIAKRLMDYSFHAPTVSFPVPGTLMIEPTESESLKELDRFADALLEIKKEIIEVEKGEADVEDNVLKNAPHIINELMKNDWEHSYSREKAAFPLESLRASKFWTSVGRIDNSYGDRNLVCSCLPIEAYEDSKINVNIL